MKTIRQLSFLFILTLIVGGTMTPVTADAKSLLDKISNTAKKGAAAVENTLNNVEKSIDSTVELASNEATPQETRDRLDATTRDVLIRLFSENPAARELFDQSTGYAVFDNRKIGVLMVSAGFGRGVAVLAETKERTYMRMGTGGLGLSLGIGGFETQVVILFENEFEFIAFVENGYDATAQTGAMFGDDNMDQTVRFIDGRSIFVLQKKGWKVSATAAGTKYWPDPDLN
ncbi:MAG: hypothetical protein ACU0CA_15940 [Paracoccaceae bacterium]